MKLLIACDVDTDAEILVADLQRAGLAAAGQAIVLAAADLLPIPPAPQQTEVPAAVRRARERTERALAEARRTAAAATARLHAAFPGWEFSPRAEADAPAWAIVKLAEQCRPDLIVVGSHDRSALGRFILGSVSLAVLTHAGCSVRIARAPTAGAAARQRLLIGVDGSSGSAAAVASVAARPWRPLTQIRIVTALDETLASTLEGSDDSEDERAAAAIVERAAAALRGPGLDVATAVIQGPPKRVLVAEAESWRADCVFVGARGLRAGERFLLGSVSAAVAARAHCSVEVVRA